MLFKKSTFIPLSLCERGNRKQYDQQSSERTAQLFGLQSKSTLLLDAGKLSKELLKALDAFQKSAINGQQIPLMEFMNLIELVDNRGDLEKKLPARLKHDMHIRACIL